MIRMNRLLMMWILAQGISTGFSQTEFSTCFFDCARERVVPVTVYQPEKEEAGTRVVIFSHRYDGNSNVKSSQTYSYLTRFLAGKGFYVISIQHELPLDPPLAMEGHLMETRMPNWERGVGNILFVLHEFRKLKPSLDWGSLR